MTVSSTARYKHLAVSSSPYTPERPSKLKATHLKYIKKLCLPCRNYVKQAEKLLFSYNAECCRIAPFFYDVAEYAKHITNDESSGIAIDHKKEHFSTDKLKELQNRSIHLCNVLQKIVLAMAVGSVVIGVVVFLGAMVGLYIALKKDNPYILVSFLLSVLCCISIFVTLMSVGRTMINLMRRVMRVKNESLVNHFDNMYNRLQFVRQENTQFLYDIEEGNKEEENLVYCLANHIYRANEKRLLVRTSSDALFDGSTI